MVGAVIRQDAVPLSLICPGTRPAQDDEDDDDEGDDNDAKNDPPQPENYF